MNLKKIGKITGISLGAVIALLFVLPFLFKGKIVNAVKEAANNNFNAKVSFNDDVSLSLLRNFPNLSLGIDNVKVVGVDSFAQDTLIDAKSIRLVLDLASVWKGETVVIRKIAISDARAQIIFLKSGATNFDIAKPDTTAVTATQDTAATSIAIKINDLSIENTRLHYVDHSMDFEITSNGLNWHANGDFADEIFTLKNDLLIDQFTMSYGRMTMLSKAKIDANTNIDMDLKKMRFGFADNEFKINALPLQAKGWVEMREKDMDMDIDVRTPNSDFKSFLSVVPGCYIENFADVKASGSLKLVFLMKGIMDDVRMPSTHAELNVDKAGFQYPGMPASASNIKLNFLMDNTDGNPDNTHLVIAPLQAVLGGDPISVELDMKTPISNPYAKGKIDINLHLDEWKKLIPLESGTGISGEVKAHFAFDGHYSALAKENIAEEQLNDLKASGDIALNQIKYNAAGTLPLSMKSLSMSVSPSDFVVVGDGIQYGKSAMSLNGKLQNMLGYYLNDETLKGQLVINSKSIDLNEWMSAMSSSAVPAATEGKKSDGNGAEGTTAAANGASNTATTESPRIPDNLDLMFNMNASRLIYEDYDLQQVTAKAEIKYGILNVNPLAASIFGARMEIESLSYTNPIGGKPTVKGGFNILNVNPANLATTLSLVKEYAPIVGRIHGLANIETQMGMQLKPNMDMDLATLTAGGLFNLFSGNLDVPTWMGETAKQLQWGAADKMSLKPTKAGFLIENGQFKLKDSIGVNLPKECQMKLGGYVDLSKQLHLGGTLMAKGRKLPFTITGDMKNPKLTVGWKGALKEAAAPVINQLKDKAFDALNKQVADILKEAKEKADLLRSNGKETADKMRTEAKELAAKQRSETDKAYTMAMEKAKKEADALVAAAKDPLQKKLTKVAAEKLLKEADKKATEAKGEGYKLADQTEAKGNQKADQLESTVNDKADQVELAAKNRTDEMIKQAKAKADAATK
ncbi:MAG: hypothetical protein RL525_282 [Bacteroidota bacterium]|jgi:hypothetical protein